MIWSGWESCIWRLHPRLHGMRVWWVVLMRVWCIAIVIPLKAIVVRWHISFSQIPWWSQVLAAVVHRWLHTIWVVYSSQRSPMIVPVMLISGVAL